MTTLAALAERLHATHGMALAVGGEVDDAAFRRRPATTAPSIGFHLWHVARWSDRLQSGLGASRELWESEAFAARWDLANAKLGHAATGMGLGDEESASLRLPEKDEVLGYARAVFEAVERRLGALEERDLAAPCPSGLYAETRTIAELLLRHFGHVSRHLGMIEALRGVHGLRGTATV